MSRLVLLLAAACVVAAALAPPVSAQGSGGGGGRRGNRAVADLATAKKTFLDAPTPQERDFTALIFAAGQEATDRKLPSTMDQPEANYSPEFLAFREEVYGELRARPAVREFLRSLVRRPPTGAFDFSSATAAMVLADAPDADDLQALLDGYRATSAESRAAVARQLGRAVGTLRAAAPMAAADEALALLRADAAEGKAAARGAAIEALYRAGCEDEALAVVKPLLTAGADPLETVTLLSACSRLFRRPNLDPLMKARALAAAGAAVDGLLAGDQPVAATQVISGQGRALRATVAFLQEVGGDSEFELLMRCLTEPRGARLLGMDGQQSLRFALQGKRDKVAPALGARLDEHYLGFVTSAGQRLFDLDEAPLEQEEKESFFEARDQRYNALSYLCSQFARTAAVKERIGKESDLVDHLVALYRAKEDVRADPSDSSSPYVAVVEKLENRVLALQLLALIEREWHRRSGLDLFAESFGVLCLEIQAPLQDIAAVVAFRRARAPGLELEVPITKAPDDAWVQNACCQAIANLGYVVQTSGGRIRIEVDAKNPWPWPDEGAAAPGD